MQRKALTQFLFSTFFTFFGVQITLVGQISVVPPSCYPGLTSTEQDAMASNSNGEAPFATWKGAYDYAITNGITNIDFAPGTYFPGGSSGASDRWGDANGGFDLLNGMNVNGNGAIINNTGNNNSIAFATVESGASLNGFTFIEFTGNNAGAVRVNANSTGWSINDCNFNGCDWAGDGLSILGGTGIVNNCNFYNHTRSTGSALTINGGNISIENSTFTCNSRIVAGGAVRVLGGIVDFTSCTFDGNNTNSASGGAISIEGGATVSMDLTKFSCNTANVNTQDDGGAIHFIGASLDITSCTFQGNVAKDRGGAIHASGVGFLNISNTTFSGNSVNTGSTSKGGAIFMNDVADNDISECLFQNNTATGEGGGVYIAAGSGGMYNFISNSFSGNSAGSNACTGRDVFTERHITGSNNDLQYLADGHHLSNSPGSLQFTDLAIAGTTLQGNPVYDSESVVMTSGLPLYWTTTMYSTGLNSAARMAYVLSGSNADLTQGSGLALVFRRYSSTDCDLEFVSYTGGVDGTLTTLATLVNTAAVSGSFAIKSIYNNGNWTFNVTNYGGSDALSQDPRGFRYCNSVISSSGALQGNNVGFFWQHSSSISSVFAQFGDSYFRAGDETTGTGGLGSGLAAACSSCVSDPAVTPNCPALSTGSIQGDVFFDSNLNGINNSGEALENVIVELLDNAGNVVATTMTDIYGHYIFTGLTTGAYQVRFGVPVGYSQATSTMQNIGGTSIDSDISSNATGSSFLSPIININTSSGMSNGLDQFNNAANIINVGAGYQAIILPVEWSRISLESQECQNVLTWITESETNNDYFVIEKSGDGKEFYSIGKIKGNGNANTPSEYEFLDDKNIHNTVYYKIKQVDFDGRYDYSPMVKSLPSDCQKSTYVNLYPNPSTNDILNITINGVDFTSSLIVNIYNQIGELILQKSFTPAEQGKTLVLNTENIPSGYYNVSISQASDSHIFEKIKFIKI